MAAMNARHIARMALLLLLCMAGSLQAQAVLPARISPDRIVLGEEAQLRIDAGAMAGLPDLAPLEPDFVVRSHRQERSSVVQQGRFIALVTHVVGLQPRRAGTLRVPPLRIGAALTPALSLQVEPGNTAGMLATAGPLPQVRSQLSSSHVWVGQPVRLSVTVLLDETVASGELFQDPPPHSQLQREGADQSHQVLHDGQPALAVTRHYLLTPEQPGALSIPGARFVGQPIPGLWTGNGAPVSRMGASQLLQVRRLPSTADTPWLPLDDLQLRWLPGPAEGVVGQSVRFTLEAVLDGAVSVPAGLLELPAEGPGWRLYPEPVQVEAQTVAGRPVQRVQRTFAVVPRAAGTLSLPPVQLAWWRARDGQRQLARVEGPQIVVRNADGAAATPDPERSGAVAAEEKNGSWPRGAILSAAALLVLAGVAFMGWRRSIHRRKNTLPVPSEGPSRALRHALDHGSVQDVMDVLCTEGGHAGRDAVLAALADPRQQQAILMAEKAWWTPAGNRAAARTVLRSAFANGARWHEPPSPPPEDPLPPLYPPSTA